MDFYVLGATINAAFMILGRSRAKDSSKGGSYIDMLSYNIFDIKEILKKLHNLRSGGNYIAANDRGRSLFFMNSFPIMCMYGFTFSIYCMLLGILGQWEDSCEPNAKVSLIVLTALFVLVFVFGWIWCETPVNKNKNQYLDYRNNPSEDNLETLTQYIKVMNLENKRKPFRTYSQSLILLLLFFVIIVSLFISNSLYNGSIHVWSEKTSETLFHTSLFLSIAIPFLPYIIYACKIRHRRNILVDVLRFDKFKRENKGEEQEAFIDSFEEKEKYIKRHFRWGPSIAYPLTMTLCLFAGEEAVKKSADLLNIKCDMNIDWWLWPVFFTFYFLVQFVYLFTKERSLKNYEILHEEQYKVDNDNKWNRFFRIMVATMIAILLHGKYLFSMKLEFLAPMLAVSFLIFLLLNIVLDKILPKTKWASESS